MIKHFFVIFTSCFLFVACSSNNNEIEIPENVLTKKKMIDVLTLFYLAEGTSGINVKNVETPKFDSTYAFNPLKDKGINKSTFDSSLVFYSKHPTTLKLIYEKVLENLSEIQAKGKVE